jgi:FecR protein
MHSAVAPDAQTGILKNRYSLHPLFVHHRISGKPLASRGKVVMNNKLVPLALLAMGFVLLAQPAKAQDYSNIRIVRLSFVEGNVQYQRPGQDWQDARLNLPIQEGFALRTTDGYAEVEFEDSLTLRLATNAIVEFTDLALRNGGRVTELTVPQGTAIISAKLKREDAVSVAAPKLNLNLPRNGRFRMDISPTNSWVTVFHGKVEVDSHNGIPTLLSGGHTLHVDASGSGSPEVANNPPQDDFDKWVSHREEALNAAQTETSSVLGANSYTTGYADLYNYGVWSYIPGYGAGWMPYGVGMGWMPFMDGQWQFMGGTGWNWMSGEPWGWLPYHFGSWVNTPGVGWAWLPVGANTWTPATARWVRLNNQLGWIPNGPPLSSKPTKTQLAALPSTVILAGQGANGAIGAGTRMPLARGGMSLEAASAPSPSFNAPTKQLTQATPLVNGPANSKSFVQSAPASLARVASAPASLHAPNASTTQPQGTRLSSMPHAMMAPHSAPAPLIARGASNGVFMGHSGGAGGGGNTGTMTGSSGTSVTASPSTSATGSASHSSGSMGSSGGHR